MGSQAELKGLPVTLSGQCQVHASAGPTLHDHVPSLPRMGLFPSASPEHGSYAQDTAVAPRSDQELVDPNVHLGFTAGVFQVLGFAAFFALVLKRVEDEEEPVAPLPGRLSSPGNGARVQA